jgi:hypothetical protein
LADPAKSTAGIDPLAWIRDHWTLVGGLVLVLLVLWVASRESRRDTGRYVLVKDDVPCQSATESTGRRWCYIVLDTRTGKLEERVRKLGARDSE